MSSACASLAIQEDQRLVEQPRIRILLVDDHKLLREGLTGLLSDELDLQIIGEAQDGFLAVEKARELLPDVILMDISMPRMNGIEATRAISRDFPNIRIIGLSMHEKEDMAAAMRDAGAVNYLPKDTPSAMLIEAIRTAGRGA